MANQDDQDDSWLYLPQQRRVDLSRTDVKVIHPNGWWNDWALPRPARDCAEEHREDGEEEE